MPDAAPNWCSVVMNIYARAPGGAYHNDIGEQVSKWEPSGYNSTVRTCYVINFLLVLMDNWPTTQN